MKFLEYIITPEGRRAIGRKIYETSGVGSSLSVAEIMAALGTEPDLDRDTVFYIRDTANNRVFFVLYDYVNDTFHYERLAKAN